MKKILIIAYYYPPANFVGSDRVESWARHLYKFGYYPVIITRNWNKGQRGITEKVEHNELTHEVYDTHEVYRLPHNQTVRDKLNDYPANPIFALVRKSLSFAELILNNFWVGSIPYKNMFDFAKGLILKNKEEYKCLIVSARPFQLFYFAYLLKKQTGINWIADYRDMWSSHSTWVNFYDTKGSLQKFIYKLERRSELKWTSNASVFTSVSDLWVDTLKEVIHKDGYLVMNGFNKEDYSLSAHNPSDGIFIITYSGTLYDYQPIEIFLQAVIQNIVKYDGQIDIRVNLIGITAIEQEAERVRKFIAGYEKWFNISDRIPKGDMIELQNSSDLLLCTNYRDTKGCYPVKIFEYIAGQTPTLLCPGDNDVVEQLIKDTNTGFVKNTIEECFLFLSECIELKLKGQHIALKKNSTLIDQFSRETQAGKLAEVIERVIRRK